MNKSPEFQKFMKVQEALKALDGEISTAGLNESTISYNIGAYGSLGSLDKQQSQLIISNAKYDFLATFNSRFIFDSKLRFLSLVSLPNAKFFSAPNLDTYDTLLLIYDPSIEPKYQVDKVMREQVSEEEKKEVINKQKEYSQDEIKEIHNRYREIMEKCKLGNMFSVLLVLNNSLMKEDAEYHPIVKAYREKGFQHPVVKIDKFGENAITLLYNIVLKLAEPERIQRIEYYKKKREEKEKQKEAEQKEKEEKKSEKGESKRVIEKSDKRKCGIF